MAFLPLGPVSGEFHFSLGDVLFSYSLPDGGPGRRSTPAVQEPTIVLAGYEGQPEISGMACAKRASDEHNLAFRCNAPVAMNVPGGKASSSRFLTEMEAETGLRLGRDFWAGDPDAGTGARLLTARDVVTGMRFTLRYIDERGFTRAANSCADPGRWRWSYVCITDAQWAAKSMVEQCHFVVDEMLGVEGGPVRRWTFAPLPAPGTAEGTPIAIGFTLDPLAITDKAALCREVAAQEQISAALYSFQTAAYADSLALSPAAPDRPRNAVCRAQPADRRRSFRCRPAGLSANRNGAGRAETPPVDAVAGSGWQRSVHRLSLHPGCYPGLSGAGAQLIPRCRLWSCL